jgi:rare lipoprotein A (peptidoglycan hydrolase)
MAQQSRTKFFLVLWLTVFLTGLALSHTTQLEPKQRKPRPVIAKKITKMVPVAWKIGQVTTYAKKFEGRPMASGPLFSHKKHYVACRGGQFGRRIEIRYGKNGRAICIIADRGGLPLHQPNCWQFDVSKRVARELGLYKVVHGKTDRHVRWRYISD